MAATKEVADELEAGNGGQRACTKAGLSTLALD